MPADFEYVAPTSVPDAVSLWREVPGAAYMLGGTDLLPQMRTGRVAPARLVDLKKVVELKAFRRTPDGCLAIGAAVPLADVERHPEVVARFPLLVACVRTVGAWPLRQRATLAGNICNASPAADTAVALLALDAMVNVSSAMGRRSIPASGFFLGPGQTALLPGELVTDVVLPTTSAGFQGSYLRLSRRKGMDLATVGVLVGRAGRAHGALYRIALAAVAPTPLRVRPAEAILEARGPSAAAEAADLAVAACSPIDDLRGSAEYRREMVGVLLRRGVAALR